jgi:hypothetical protein
MVKVKKVTTNEAHEAKKVAKLVATELGFAKKLTKKPKGEREKTYGPFNPRNANGGASIEKEFSKGKTFKDNLHVLEQVQSSSNSLDSSEEEEKNPKYVNIMKKLIKTSKHRRSPRRPKDGQELLSLHRFDGPRTVGRYVQTFTSMLSLILMKEEYA